MTARLELDAGELDARELDARPEVDARNAATFGAAELARMRGGRVGVLGLGMLGWPIAERLALLRIPLLLVDPGRVEAPNLGNQSLLAAALGEPKAAVRARQIEALVPGAPVEVRGVRLEELGLGVLADCALLVSALDSRASRLRLAERAQLVGVPWIDAALDGSGTRLLGTVTAYDADPDAACYGCRLGPADFGAIAREGRPAGCPSWSDPGIGEAPPTLAAPAFASVVAGFAGLFVLRCLLGRSAEIAGSQLRIGADGEPRLARNSLARSRRCPLPHRRLAPPRAVPAATLGEILAAAERELGAGPVSLRFHGRVLAAGLRCAVSGATRDVLRVREALAPRELRCQCCSPANEVVPVHQLERLDVAMARRYAHRRLDELGLPGRDLFSATAPGGAELCYALNPSETSAATTRSAR